MFAFRNRSSKLALQNRGCYLSPAATLVALCLLMPAGVMAQADVASPSGAVCALDTPAERASKLSRQGVPAVGITMATDPEGEVLARGNHILKSYWNNPEASAEALADDWFHTGDGGVIDDDGYLTLQDRKKDVIISGGENISSIEVEDCLFSHPAVEEVAVIGVPDEKWGETVKALVVVGGDADVSERDLIDYCREKIAHYKCPTSVEFRHELARTATGKLQKFKLRAPYWEGVEKGIN